MSTMAESSGESDDSAMSESEDDEEFPIHSDDAYVAIAAVTCRRCLRPFDAICIFCRSGTAFEEELNDFTVANVHAVDESLAEQLAAWATYHAPGTTADPGDWANHCPRCGEPIDDQLLHDEPEDPFFDIPHAERGAIRMVRLEGSIRLSGDEHYTIEED